MRKPPPRSIWTCDEGVGHSHALGKAPGLRTVEVAGRRVLLASTYSIPALWVFTRTSTLHPLSDLCPPSTWKPGQGTAETHTRAGLG